MASPLLLEDRRGLLVALEGIDGSGKSTQMKHLAEWLRPQGYGVVELREPTHGPIGSEIRRLAVEGRLDAESEFRLFLEDRTENVEQNIAPGLRRGDIVLVDRYYISSMAYQGARGIDIERIRQENEKIAPRPDLVVMFEIPIQNALSRITLRETDGPNHFEKADYLTKVQAIFDRLDWPEIRRIDADRPQEAIQTDLRQLLEPYVKRIAQQPPQ